jgi:broad specificity phosphatase PhoE
MDTGLSATQDPRLNELEYFTLAKALETEHGVAMPTEQGHFTAHLPQVFAAWQDGILEGAPETFQSFETRVRDALAEIAAGQGPALVVTSGGLISMTMRQHLGLTVAAMANVALAIMNTSIHRLHPIGGTWAPVMFNAIPHLEAADRHHAQTHV